MSDTPAVPLSVLEAGILLMLTTMGDIINRLDQPRLMVGGRLMPVTRFVNSVTSCSALLEGIEGLAGALSDTRRARFQRLLVDIVDGEFTRMVSQTPAGSDVMQEAEEEYCNNMVIEAEVVFNDVLRPPGYDRSFAAEYGEFLDRTCL
jgi:hypothetical protein